MTRGRLPLLLSPSPPAGPVPVNHCRRNTFGGAISAAAPSPTTRTTVGVGFQTRKPKREVGGGAPPASLARSTSFGCPVLLFARGGERTRSVNKGILWRMGVIFFF